MPPEETEPTRWPQPPVGVQPPVGTQPPGGPEPEPESPPPPGSPAAWLPPALHEAASGPLPAPAAQPGHDEAACRERAVHLFCVELCGIELAREAVTRILPQGADPAESPEELLGRTRTVAAELTPSPRLGGWRGLMAAEQQSDCDGTPQALAARANGELPADEAEALEWHLRNCGRCRELEARFARAEEQFLGTMRGERSTRWLPDALIRGVAPAPVGDQAWGGEEEPGGGFGAGSSSDAPPAAAPPPGPNHGRGLRVPLIVGGALLLAAAVVVAAILLAGGSSKPSAPAAKRATASHAAARPRARARRARHRRRHHRTSPASATTATTGTRTSSSSTPSSSSTSTSTSTTVSGASASSSTRGSGLTGGSVRRGIGHP